MDFVQTASYLNKLYQKPLKLSALVPSIHSTRDSVEAPHFFLSIEYSLDFTSNYVNVAPISIGDNEGASASVWPSRPSIDAPLPWALTKTRSTCQRRRAYSKNKI